MAWLISPLAWLLFAGALVPCACCLRRRRLWLLAACGVLAAVAVACMTPLGANALARPLEARSMPASRACLDAPPSHAVVLGGGVDGRPRNRADFSALNLASRRRVERAVAWWREGDGRMLVLVGGPPHQGVAALAELMAAYAQVLGVPPAALRVETDSDDTWGNARHAAALWPRLPRRVVLVTSWIHMPRARGAFVSAGFDVCPLGSDFRRLPSRLPWALVPRSSALANTEIALHEWVGLAYYRWRARRVAGAAAPIGKKSR
jgi:uncharacterized SAM-binding protein YcdF (DUF218 family)